MALRKWLFAAGLGLILPSQTYAQIELKPDTPTSGVVDAALPREARANCFRLNTEPGSRWQVDLKGSFDTLLLIGRGDTCQSATWDIQNDDSGFMSLNSRLIFSAGGGSYLIHARGLSEDNPGTFTLTAKRLPEMASARRLLPGRPILPPPTVGTASTHTGTEPQQTAGQTLKDCDLCPELVVVGPGSFMMGSASTDEGHSPQEGPRHLVTLHRAFAIGKYEVTHDEYAACVTDQACQAAGDQGFGRGRRPVLNLSYAMALQYVAWLSNKTGQKYFIPSESEWEYAARGGTDTPWNTGTAILTEDANILNQFGKTVVVGSYPANAFGLHDVHGNVGEWTQDCLDTGYLGAPVDGSAASSGDCLNKRMVRSGKWDSTPIDSRSSQRGFAPSNTPINGAGLRVTRALE